MKELNSLCEFKLYSTIDHVLTFKSEIALIHVNNMKEKDKN